MTEPNLIICKDGVRFRVYERPPGRILVEAGFRDRATDASGLGAYQTSHKPGDLTATHEGMPVEIVRAYARAHGGVAEAGETALALLKRLPTAAALAEQAAAVSSKGAGEVAPAAGFRPAERGPDVARRPAAEASAGAPDQRHGGGSPALEVDTLTPLVIEARKVLAEFDGPFLYEGREPTTDQEALVVWGRRGSTSLRLSGHLRDATLPRFASHPLREEALALRERMEAHLLAAIPHLTTSRVERKAG